MIVVAGGPGAWFSLHRSSGGGILGNDFITKKIQLPKDWTKLVAKYKDLVPNYELY